MRRNVPDTGWFLIISDGFSFTLLCDVSRNVVNQHAEDRQAGDHIRGQNPDVPTFMHHVALPLLFELGQPIRTEHWRVSVLLHNIDD